MYIIINIRVLCTLSYTLNINMKVVFRVGLVTEEKPQGNNGEI